MKHKQSLVIANTQTKGFALVLILLVIPVLGLLLFFTFNKVITNQEVKDDDKFSIPEVGQQIQTVNTPSSFVPSPELSPTPSEKMLSHYEIKFPNTDVEVKFKTFIDIEYPIKQNRDGSYEVPPILNIYFKKSLQEVTKQDFVRDSDGNNSATGCYFDKNTVIDIEGYEFQKQICYYNTIAATKSGRYDPNISSTLSSSCIYNYPNERGVIDFHTEAGADACDYIKQRFKSIQFK